MGARSSLRAHRGCGVGRQNSPVCSLWLCSYTTGGSDAELCEASPNWLGLQELAQARVNQGPESMALLCCEHPVKDTYSYFFSTVPGSVGIKRDNEGSNFLALQGLLLCSVLSSSPLDVLFYICFPCRSVLWLLAEGTAPMRLVGELRVAAGMSQPGKVGGQLWLWTQFWNCLYRNRIMLRSQELDQVLKKFLSLLHQDTQQPDATQEAEPDPSPSTEHGSSWEAPGGALPHLELINQSDFL